MPASFAAFFSLDHCLRRIVFSALGWVCPCSCATLSLTQSCIANGEPNIETLSCWSIHLRHLTHYIRGNGAINWQLLRRHKTHKHQISINCIYLNVSPTASNVPTTSTNFEIESDRSRKRLPLLASQVGIMKAFSSNSNNASRSWRKKGLDWHIHLPSYFQLFCEPHILPATQIQRKHGLHVTTTKLLKLPNPFFLFHPQKCPVIV